MATSQPNPAPQPLPHFGVQSRHPMSFLGRNLGLIITVSLIVAAWLLVYTFTMFHPKYGAKATVIIKDSAITNRYVEPEQFYAMQTTTSTSSNPVLNTMGILKSEAISNALWAYFSEKHPEELKRLKIKTKKDWERFYQDGSSFIKAKNQPGTDLISIQYSWTEPTIAQESLTVVVKAFQDASRDLNKEEQISRTRFLSRQMGDIEAKLQAIREQKSQYESKNATVSVKRESDDLAGSRMELSNKLAQLQGQAQGKENLVRRYRQMLGMSPEAALRGAALGQNSTMVKLQDELYRLQQLHTLMSSSLTDNNPKVREVQAQIDQVQTNIEQEKVRVMGAGSSDANGEVIADSTRGTLIGDMLKAQGEAQDLRAQAARIEQRLGQINADIRSFPSTAIGLANLEQQETTLSTALDHLRQKVMEGKMKEAQTLSNVFIVDSPRLPEHASFPNRIHLTVISIMMAVASGIAVAFIKEQIFTGRPNFAPNDAANLGHGFQPHDDEESARFGSLQNNFDSANAYPERHVQEESWQANPTSQMAVAETQTTQEELSPTVASSSVQTVAPVVKNAPNADDVLGVHPPIEKVEVPVTGSLFDSLLPIAGPMARSIGNVAPSQPHQTTNVLRRDLTQPLSFQDEYEYELRHPHTEPASHNPQFYQDEDLLPPPSTPELQQVQQASERLAQAYPPAQGVPVMHAAPSATPAYQNDPLSVTHVEHTAEQESDAAVDEFPNLVLDEALFAQPTVATSESTIAEPEDPATIIYETQAKAMPLPRKRRVRSVPAFLLDDKTIDVQAEAQDDDRRAPYELIPRRQRKESTNPMMPTPGSSAQTTQNGRSSEELFHDFSPVPTTPSANLANSNFPPMPDFIPPEFAKRRHGHNKGLFGGLFSASRKARQQELVLGGHLHPRNRY